VLGKAYDALSKMMTTNIFNHI